MLSNAHLTAFASTAQPALSRNFYQRTLGLPMRSEDDFALVFDANGVELRIQKVETVVPHPYTALGWTVSDLHDVMTELTGRGVTFELYPFLDQDADGVWTAPSGTRVAWFKDPDGNLLSLAEHDAG